MLYDKLVKEGILLVFRFRIALTILSKERASDDVIKLVRAYLFYVQHIHGRELATCVCDIFCEVNQKQLITLNPKLI